MSLPLAVIGAPALYALFAWMASAIAASQLSGEKGFGERVGLASGLILAPIGLLIWLIVPARSTSDWTVKGPSAAGIAVLVLSLLVGLAAIAFAILGDVSTIVRALLGVLGLLFAAFAAVGLAASRRRSGSGATAPAAA